MSITLDSEEVQPSVTCSFCARQFYMQSGDDCIVHAEARFREATVQALFYDARAEHHQHMKLGAEACRLKGELMRIFVSEAMGRVAQIAATEGFDEVHIEHVRPRLHVYLYLRLLL